MMTDEHVNNLRTDCTNLGCYILSLCQMREVTRSKYPTASVDITMLTGGPSAVLVTVSMVYTCGGCNETRKVSKSHALSVEGLRSMSGTRFICDAAEVNVRRLLVDVKHKIDQATTGCILATSESFEG